MTFQQLSFLPQQPNKLTKTGLLDAGSDALLEEFRSARLREAAHPESVRREVSQLRSLARELRPRAPRQLAELLTDLPAVARALCEPRNSIARSTSRTRLIAFQRFVQIVGPKIGVEPRDALARLDGLLPGSRPTNWHTTGVMVAGKSGRQRSPGPTLSKEDLERIVEAAGLANDECASRNKALVALQCFSGLRVQEVVGLRWEALGSELIPTGHYGLSATVNRQGRRVRLLLLGPSNAAVDLLSHSCGGSVETLTGTVFRASQSSMRPLSYRAAREVLRSACGKAGLPIVESVQLRAACAYWLGAQGLSNHEVASVLGLARVRSVDRLLSGHAALDAQRRVREVMHG